MLTRRKFLDAAGAATISALLAPAVARAAPARSWFDQRFGAWVAGDVPRSYDIGNGRTLWATNDSFLTTSSSKGGSLGDAAFVRNTLFIEINGQLALTHPAQRAFLDDTSASPIDQWWWFHAGMVVDDQLKAFVTRMRRVGPSGWAINFEYAETWLATISTRNWQLVALRPAPNPGTHPVYGFAISNDRDWTYLHGNHALYGDRTTSNYLAKVPYGQLDATPAYWNGSRWRKDPAEAASIHTAGSYAYRMHVVSHHDTWLATCKVDEFYGDHIDVLTANSPTGPWRTVRRLTVNPISGDDRTCTYDAQCRPVGDRLELWWSNNAFDEDDVRTEPARYRPTRTQITI